MFTLFHDYTSPASAVAVARAQRLADDGLAVTIEGFDAVGIDIVVPATIDVVAEADGVAGAAEEEGVTVRRPEELPPTARCHVLEGLAAETGLAAAWRRAAYAAFWRDAADLDDRAVLLGLAEQVGLDSAAAARGLDDRAAVAAVRRRTAKFRREGVGGVPTILCQRTLVPGLLPEDDLRALAAL